MRIKKLLNSILVLITPENIGKSIDSFNKGVKVFNENIQDFGDSMQKMNDEFSDDIVKSKKKAEIQSKIDKANLDKIWGKKP